MRVAAAVAIAVAICGTAGAAWSTSVSGTAAARAGQLVGNAPTASKSGLVTISVNLSWTPTPAATGYRIERSGGVGTIGGTCTGTVASTSCTDSPVAPLTTYVYTVTPVTAGWTGQTSSGTTVTT